MCRAVDILISLGGDGTLLALVRKSYGYNKPILGINAGNLGFLADTRVEEIDDMIDLLINREYRVDRRMLIYGYIETEVKKHKILRLMMVGINKTHNIPHYGKNWMAFMNCGWFKCYNGNGLPQIYPLRAPTQIIYPLEGPIPNPLPPKVIYNGLPISPTFSNPTPSK